MNKNYELIKKIIEDGKYKVLEDEVNTSLSATN